jgi:putative polymerase
VRSTATSKSGANLASALLAGALVLIAVCFNAGLAFVNANVMPIPAAAVVASEILIVAAALLVALIYFQPQMLAWFLLLAILICIFLARSLLTGEIAPKYARDVLLIPAFIVLGMAAGDRPLDRIVLLVFSVVVAAAAFEVLAPEAYAATFRIQDFYIQTRGARLEDFYTTDSDLFINAVRPSIRLFSFLDLPRLSSVFLEPVSLGNYCTIMTAYLCARARHIGLLGTLLLALGTAALLLGSDGRLATTTSLVIVVLSLLAVRRLPPYGTLLYLPIAVAGAFVTVSVTGASAFGDDALGRLARSVLLLQRGAAGQCRTPGRRLYHKGTRASAEWRAALAGTGKRAVARHIRLAPGSHAEGYRGERRPRSCRGRLRIALPCGAGPRGPQGPLRLPPQR